MRWPSYLVLALSLASLSGCGGSENPTTPTTGGASISIVGQNGAQAFTPNPAPFGGQSVVFKNNDRSTHRIVLNDGSVDTGDIAPGATSRAVTMPGSGTNFHCMIHPGMIGSASGQSGTAPPPCEGAYCSPY